MITTRWKDNEAEDFNKIIELLATTPADEINKESTTYANWNIVKVFDANEQIKLNGKNIDFNFFKYKYDQISPGDQPEEDRTVKNEGVVIPYYSGVTVNYIINRNSDAQKILRKMLNYSGRNEIEKNMFSLDNDFFIWLINKVYTNENVIEAYNEDLHSITLDAIKGFKGNTEDLLTKVSANGESVMNIISTLSFFLESRNLHQITLDLGYYDHQNIKLVLTNKGKNGTISTYEEQYQGLFEDDQDKNTILPKLMLLVYLEIIPILVQAYHSDLENGVWSEEENINFLKKVAEELSEKVQKRVESLQK